MPESAPAGGFLIRFGKPAGVVVDSVKGWQTTGRLGRGIGVSIAPMSTLDCRRDVGAGSIVRS